MRRMAQARQWTVPPDSETGEVDQELLGAALYDAGVMLRRAGGMVGMQAIRLQVDGPEHVTTHVVVQWHARTDSKPRFEESAAPAPAAEPVEDPDEPENPAEPEGK
jgi:hypothetical protein